MKKNAKYLLRLGVHSGCNQRCLYCNPTGNFSSRMMADGDLVDIIVGASALGIRKAHLTGGEPLLRRSLAQVLSTARDEGADMEYYMTTNGVLLAEDAAALSEAGLKRVNVSLDSLKPRAQEKIAQAATLDRVLDGLDVAAGLFDSVKMNMVIMREYNLGEIGNAVEFCQEKGIVLRLMELLPFSTSEQPPDFFLRNHVPKRELEVVLGGLGKMRRADVGGNNWACDYWKVGGMKTPVGIVYHHSRGYFCVKDRCNSIRVGPGGDLAACYTQGAPSTNIAGLSRAAKRKELERTIETKEKLEKGALAYPPYHIPDYSLFRANIGGRKWKA